MAKPSGASFSQRQSLGKGISGNGKNCNNGGLKGSGSDLYQRELGSYECTSQLQGSNQFVSTRANGVAGPLGLVPGARVDLLDKSENLSEGAEDDGGDKDLCYPRLTRVFCERTAHGRFDAQKSIRAGSAKLNKARLN